MEPSDAIPRSTGVFPHTLPYRTTPTGDVTHPSPSARQRGKERKRKTIVSCLDPKGISLTIPSFSMGRERRAHLLFLSTPLGSNKPFIRLGEIHLPLPPDRIPWSFLSLPLGVSVSLSLPWMVGDSHSHGKGSTPSCQSLWTTIAIETVDHTCRAPTTRANRTKGNKETNKDNVDTHRKDT